MKANKKNFAKLAFIGYAEASIVFEVLYTSISSGQTKGNLLFFKISGHC
jgi:hypothetical protein